jgi:hypothetical protein
MYYIHVIDKELRYYIVLEYYGIFFPAGPHSVEVHAEQP